MVSVDSENRSEVVENCSGCKHAIFDEKWGEYKCAVKKRRCTAAEASIGCARWTKKEKEKTN